MRISVTYDVRNPPQWRVPYDTLYHDTLDHMAMVEDWGFDAVWIQQHHFEESAYGPSFAAFAGALAMCTKRIRVGTSIKILPLYHPLLVAEEMAVLDQLLRGRLDVGVGIGHRLKEFEILGVPKNQRPSRIEEGIEIMRQAWTQERVNFHGRRFTIDDAEVQPKPMQQPHPPIWMATRTPAASERAARLGCNLKPGSTDPEVYRTYARGLKERGESFDGYQVTVSLSAIVTKDNPDTVWERLRPHYQYRRAFFDKIIAEFGDTPLSGTPAGEMATAATKPGVYGDEMVGSPDTILRNLEDLRATWSWDGLKPTDLIIRTPPPGVPLKEFESSFELFVREIMPVVRGW